MSLPVRRPTNHRQRGGHSIQAAARLMPVDDARFVSPQPVNTGGFAWQTRAWHIVKHLGIVHYGMDFIKDNVAQLEFFVAETSDDPEAVPEPLDLDNPAAIELERFSNGPYGGISDLFAQLVVHNEVGGESWLSVRYEQDGTPVRAPDLDSRFDQVGDDFTEVWEVLTPQTKKQRENNQKMKAVQSVRVWSPDPERPEWPDSSLRSVLTECEQLLLIQQHVTGVLQSRLHNGILLVPEELDPTPPGPPDEGDDEMSPLMRDMFEVFSSPMQNPDAAAAVMPYLLMGKGELLEHVKHVSLAREFDKKLLDIAEHLKITIAGGMDLPAERLLGMGGSNHWNVWYLDESTYVQHLAPDVELVVDGLLRAWLRPAWRAANLDPDAYTVVIDPTKLTMMSASGQPGGSPEDVSKMVTAAGVLIRAGFDPESSLVAVGLPEIPHTGLLPTTVKDTKQVEGDVTVEEVVAAALGSGLDGSTLAAIDTRILNEVYDLAAAEVARAADEAESRLVAAMAAAGISATTPDLANALADAGIAPEEIVPDGTFNEVANAATAMFAAGLVEARAAVQEMSDTPINGVIDDGDVDTAGLLLAASLTDWLRSRWFTPGPAADRGVAQLARGSAPDPDLPARIIIDAMTTAGGGPGSTPGSTGLANGATVEVWLTAAGILTAAWRWDYGSFPRESFPPHRRLSGVEFTDWESDVLDNASNRWPHNFYWYPGDHDGCGCRAVRILVPAESVLT